MVMADKDQEMIFLIVNSEDPNQTAPDLMGLHCLYI